MPYHALFSFLPMLRPEEPSWMTMDRFLDSCGSFLPEKELALLRKCCLTAEGEDFPAGSLPARYAVWEHSLRNALVRLRAARLGTDPSVSLRKDAAYETTSAAAAAAAWGITDPLERERFLDTARWKKIEELECGKLFSRDLLFGYKLKLELQAKTLARSGDRAAENLERTAEAIRSAAAIQSGE